MDLFRNQKIFLTIPNLVFIETGRPIFNENVLKKKGEKTNGDLVSIVISKNKDYKDAWQPSSILFSFDMTIKTKFNITISLFPLLL